MLLSLLRKHRYTQAFFLQLPELNPDVFFKALALFDKRRHPFLSCTHFPGFTGKPQLC